jgi:hypothetical protein
MKGHAELGSTYDTSAVHGIRLASSLEARRNNARLNHMHCLHKRALLNTRGRRYRGPGGSRGRVWLYTLCFARMRLEAHRDHPNTRSCKETAGHCSRVSENFECSAGATPKSIVAVFEKCVFHTRLKSMVSPVFRVTQPSQT